MKTVSPSRIKTARAVAILADALQIGLLPLFSEGFVSPFQDVLDVAVGVTLTWLVGWHIAFLPSFIVELAPLADLAPSWTIAVFIATRGKAAAATPKPINTQVYVEPPPQPQLKDGPPPINS